MAGTKTISILEGNTFVVSDERGDIDASPTETKGLFSADTRFLSRWLLTLNGTTPNMLSTDDLEYYSAQYFLVPGTGTVYVDADVSIIRRREVGNGFHEDLTILNLSPKPADFEVRIEAGADFLDLFQVKDKLEQKGEHYAQVENGRLVLGYRREKFVRETRITASAPETRLDEGGLSFKVHLEPHGEWNTGIEVTAALASGMMGSRRKTQHEHTEGASSSLDAWLATTPTLHCD